jgi:drug/metabolite transporter (DMT)-like permease
MIAASRCQAGAEDMESQGAAAVRAQAQKPEPAPSPPQSQLQPQSWRRGLVLGTLGMLLFSGTLPALRLAVPFFGPTLLTSCRIEIATVLGVITLLGLGRLRLPPRRQWSGIVWTSLGLGIGYPLFLALALQDVPASHGAVVVGLAPAATAIIAVLRAGERPSLRFWIGCSIGAIAVALFAFYEGGGRIAWADGWLVAAMVSVGLAYVEGGRAAREFGGTTTLSWAIIILAPFAAVPVIAAIPTRDWTAVPASAWAGFWYAGIVMFLGSVTWYRGLAAGGIARIGQLNLIQPLLAIVWSALLLGERITWPFVATAVVVAGAMTLCLKSRVAIIATPAQTLAAKPPVTPL